jgi:hypothetical protein
MRPMKRSDPGIARKLVKPRGQCNPIVEAELLAVVTSRIACGGR